MSMKKNCAESELLSAYLDKELEPAELARVETHLKACASCRAELNAVSLAKKMAGALEQKTMPAAVMAALEARAAEKLEASSWRNIFMPRVWIPAAGLAAAAFLVFFWVAKIRGPADGIPMETLIAAHQRYAEESNLPSADLTQGAFSAKLAVYQEVNEQG